MVAGIIGLFMLAALVGLFTNFSVMSKAQRGLANIQENGRFLAAKLKMDIENVGFQPCATVSMESPQLINRGFAKRPTMNYTNAALGLPSGIIDPQYLIQGHECDAAGTCSPALRNSPGGDPSTSIPEAGNDAGARAYKTDVLTVRYLASQAVIVDDSVAASTATQFSLNQDSRNKPLFLDFGEKILIANCNKSMILNAEPALNNKVTITSPGTSVSWASKGSFTSVYNFTKHFKTITYYVGLKQDPINDDLLISSMYRIENGSEPQEIVEGVERFDLTYGVQFVDGTMAYLTADQIQNASTTNCTVEPIIPADLGLPKLTNNVGCLWRSVFTVKFNVLLNTVTNSTNSKSEKFIYSPDSYLEQLPENIASGIDPGYMYRKEFSKTIALNSNNL